HCRGVNLLTISLAADGEGMMRISGVELLAGGSKDAIAQGGEVVVDRRAALEVVLIILSERELQAGTPVMGMVDTRADPGGQRGCISLVCITVKLNARA